MFNPHPVAKESKLIDSINQMVVNGIDQARLEEIKFEAKKFQGYGGAYYVAAKRVLGMVATLERDLAECERQFNAAFAHEGRSPDLLKDYATSLWNLHQFRRNLEIVDEVAELVPDDPEVIKTAIYNHWAAFDVDGVRKLLKHFHKLKLPLEDSRIPSEASLDLVSEIFAETGSTWEQFCERVEQTAAVIDGLGLETETSSANIIDGIVFFEYKLHADLDHVMSAEGAINEAVANLPYSPADRAIYFTCSAA